MDVIDHKDNIRYRYTATTKPRNEAGNTVEFLVKRDPTQKDSPRFGIAWDDISTMKDRENWIAGGSIKVIDLKTNEVMGERVGYMMDSGQGNTRGERSPWFFAQQNACPEFPTIGEFDPRRRQTLNEGRNFIGSVLKIRQGDSP